MTDPTSTGADGPLATAPSPSPREVRIHHLTVARRRVRVAVWPGPVGSAGGSTETALPLLIFNGIGASVELLAEFADQLGDTTVIAFDVPGAGDSEAPVLPYRLWMLAMFAAHILDRLGIDRVDAMGVSWGGAAVQQFALQHPVRCRRLVLAATSPGVLMVPPKWSVLRSFATPRRFNDPAYLGRVAGRIYGGKAEHHADVVRSFRGTSRRGYLLQQMALAGWTSLPWLPLLRQRTLVLAGDDDRVVTPANARLLAALIPSARLELLADGHLFVISSARETAALVTEFLAAPEPPTRRSQP